MKTSRVWAMPNKNTFECAPIKDFVMRYIRQSTLSIDPFARDSDIATVTNDLNPTTSAQYHLKAVDFLREMQKRDESPDLIIFDPPYSIEQMKRSYDSMGVKFTQADTHNALRWTEEKAIISDICAIGGYVLSFGWNTCGVGLQHGFEIEEVLIVCHGPGHYDTLCVAEKKLRHQPALWLPVEMTTEKINIS